MLAKTTKVMIVAGEASGDGHAAKLVRALREELPNADLRFFGSAGPKMRDAGVDATIRADDLSVVGLTEIGRALPMFLRSMKAMCRAAAELKPEVAILVDFPEFNLKLAKRLKRAGIKVVYYISPQLWAWRKYRISTVKKYVDLIITILPFEKDWYARHGVTHVEYVGSPLAREVHPSKTKEEFCEEKGLDPSKPIVALLPGSRQKEIVRILPTTIAAAEEINRQLLGVQFLIAVASERRHTEVDQRSEASHLNVTVVQNETYDVLNASDAAVVASGTATLETGIIGTPMVVVYKTSPLNYRIFEPMIDVPHYGLINLIAEERVCTELIQHEFTSEALTREVLRLLKPDVNQAMRARLKTVADKLGHGGASKRAAQAIVRVIRSVVT